MEIARQTRSIDAGLRWSDLAGDRLATVLEYEIYRRANPDDFTKASLARLFALDDQLAITRLAGVGREARERLFDLGPEELKRLARGLTEAELTTLAGYLTGLAQGPRERVLEAVASEPAKMQILSSARVRDGVIASRDQSAAVAMMLREDGAGTEAVVSDFQAAWEGRVAPVLVLDKHPVLIAAALILAVALLMMVRRLLFVRRVRPA
jgi:nucleotidyltransferase/DNA polymerase involved in DNA repair